jgi:hypothetical protein
MVWECATCRCAVATTRPDGSPDCSQLGHADGSARLAARCTRIAMDAVTLSAASRVYMAM